MRKKDKTYIIEARALFGFRSKNRITVTKEFIDFCNKNRIALMGGIKIKEDERTTL